MTEEKLINIFTKISEDLNRKILIYKNKHGLARKEEALNEILELFFKGKEEYSLVNRENEELSVEEECNCVPEEGGACNLCSEDKKQRLVQYYQKQHEKEAQEQEEEQYEENEQVYVEDVLEEEELEEQPIEEQVIEKEDN